MQRCAASKAVGDACTSSAQLPEFSAPEAAVQLLATEGEVQLPGGTKRVSKGVS